MAVPVNHDIAPKKPLPIPKPRAKIAGRAVTPKSGRSGTFPKPGAPLKSTGTPLAGRVGSKKPVGGVSLFGGVAAAAAGTKDMVSAFLEKIHSQIQGAFWVRRAKVELPKLEATEERVRALAKKTSLTPEQVIDNFDAVAHALDTCAQTLVMIKQFEAENDGKLPSQMRETKEKLEGFANRLTESMTSFVEIDVVISAIDELADTGDEVKIQKLEESNATYLEKAARALGIANFDQTVKEATKAMEDLQEQAKRGVDEASLCKALLSVDDAMVQLRKAQTVAERVPVALSSKARSKGRSALARLIGKSSNRLAKLVRSTAEVKEVKAVLDVSAIKQAEIDEARSAAKASEDDLDEDENVLETSSALVTHISVIEEQIEAGPEPEFKAENLSVEERKLAESLEAALLCEWDGVKPFVKENLNSLITRGLELKRIWNHKNLEGMTDDEICEDPDLFNMAQLIIEALMLYYDCNSSLKEAAESGNNKQYATRLGEIEKGVMATFELVWHHLILDPLTTADGRSGMGALFCLIDRDIGAGPGDMTDRLEDVYKKAWDLYFAIIEMKPNPLALKREEIKKLLSDEIMYP